jgi:hypothetical protein
MSRPDEPLARNRNSLLLIMAVLCLALATGVRADTISGTVKDPSGAVVAGARVEISGGSLAAPLVLTSDEAGRFAAPNLAAGKYSVRVTRDGFDESVKQVELHGNAEVPISLVIAAQQTSVEVTDKSAAFANSDPLYRQLRDAGLGTTYRSTNATLTMDVGTFEFKSGTITFRW